MLKWLKRRAPSPAPAPVPSAQRHAEAQDTVPASSFGDSALPVVVAEGNTQAEWSMWEDSMAALDSQMEGHTPSARIYVREPRPSQLDAPDAFSRVSKRGDL